jgi:hypothetical protein
MPAPGQTVFVAPYVLHHSRVTSFFRWILAIPHVLGMFVYAALAYVAVVLAWIALLITARYPRPLYAFVAGSVRYTSQVTAYTHLLSDEYPPFPGSPSMDYPVELDIGTPKERYSRLWVLVRIVPFAVLYVVSYVLSYVVMALAFAAWIFVLVYGRLPKALHDTMASCLSYLSRTRAFMTLLTESFPGPGAFSAAVDDEPVATSGAGGDGA